MDDGIPRSAQRVRAALLELGLPGARTAAHLGAALGDALWSAAA
jgi:hypothetical protein